MKPSQKQKVLVWSQQGTQDDCLLASLPNVPGGERVNPRAAAPQLQFVSFAGLGQCLKPWTVVTAPQEMGRPGGVDAPHLPAAHAPAELTELVRCCPCGHSLSLS